MNDTHRLANTLESGMVVRYHAVPTVGLQNVAHHSWGVAIIAIYITGGTASRELLQECLMHDTAEYFTGDIPFTVKRDHLDVKIRFDAMEDTAREEALLLPPANLSEYDSAVLKLADTLEGYIWCRKNETRGPVRARWVHALLVGLEKFSPIIRTEDVHRINCLFDMFS